MEFQFDNERPIYMQLVQQLRIAVVSGAFKSGSRLPSVRELALTAKVNPNTMQKALTELEGEGLVFTERTNGKFVTTDSGLLERAKRALAQGYADRFLGEMAQIGFDRAGALDYLQDDSN